MRKFAAVILMISLVGCAGSGQVGGINKQTAGTVLGGVGGGLIGSRIGGGRGKVISTIAGAILGGVVGGHIGQQLDERDKLLMARATQTTLESSPSGKSTTWRNPDTGHSGTVTPQGWSIKGNTVCRPFTQTITVDGKSEIARGSACRNRDGTWRINR